MIGDVRGSGQDEKRLRLMGVNMRDAYSCDGYFLLGVAADRCDALAL